MGEPCRKDLCAHPKRSPVRGSVVALREAEGVLFEAAGQLAAVFCVVRGQHGGLWAVCTPSGHRRW